MTIAITINQNSLHCCCFQLVIETDVLWGLVCIAVWTLTKRLPVETDGPYDQPIIHGMVLFTIPCKLIAPIRVFTNVTLLQCVSCVRSPTGSSTTLETKAAYVTTSTLWPSVVVIPGISFLRPFMSLCCSKVRVLACLWPVGLAASITSLSLFSSRRSKVTRPPFSTVRRLFSARPVWWLSSLMVRAWPVNESFS